MRLFIKKNSLYLAFIVAILGVFGSLYFSEVRHFAPCVLCWWQRIFLYSTTVILAVAIIKKDTKAHQYVLPLMWIGLAISLFQNLLYYGIIPEQLAPCTAGISCTTKFISWFGFVSIPLLALLAFVAIILLIMNYKKTHEHE